LGYDDSVCTETRCVKLIFLLFDARYIFIDESNVCISFLVCIPRRSSALVKNVDARVREREKESESERERERERERRIFYDINTFNVSKTFRDNRTRIDENPILITEPRPALAAPRRVASRMNVSIEMDFRSLF